MNILFLLRSLDIGGLEVVTTTLANKFAAEGHRVCVFAFEKRSGKVQDRFGDVVEVTIGGKYRKTKENVALLRQILTGRNIGVVINQWGLPLIPIKTLCEAKKGLSIKVISVYHNDPLQNGRIQSVETELAKTQNPVKKSLLHAKKFVYRCITGYAMRYIYQHSDAFEVLSPSFVSHFQQFTRLKHTPKLVVQTNPITIDTDGFAYLPEKKLKEIIYVGRVDYTQKRVHRVIETWAQLEHLYPDWRLTIVGDGPEMSNLEQMADDLELERIKFEGFQSPGQYYERASLLVLTSEFEGFPLVLAEAMSFGVVPIVYASYSAVYDIIENEKDGVIIEKNANGFNAAIMADKIALLMKNKVLRNKMAVEAIKKSRNYSVEIIYHQWMEILSKL